MKKFLTALLSITLLIACDKEDVDLNEKEKIYYEFGQPTTSSSTNYLDVIESSESRTFVKSENGKLSVCTHFNNNLECFENNNYDTESLHLENVIGKINCNLDSSGIHCFDGDFYCNAYFDGKIDCNDVMKLSDCTVFSDDSVICNKETEYIEN